MTQVSPYFTIITACYNADATIEQTLASMARQSFKNFEHVIVDGGSTDRTLSIVQSYQSNNPDLKILWHSEADTGIYDAFNKGIKRAQGEIICILNADDWYENDTLQSVADGFENDVDIVYGMERVISDGREFAVRLYHHSFLPDHTLCHPAVFVRKSAYDRVGLFDTQYRIASDYDFLIRCKAAGMNFKPLYQILANFRLGGISSDAQNKTRNIIEVYSVLHKNGLMSERTRVLRTAYNSTTHRMIRWCKKTLDILRIKI